MSSSVIHRDFRSNSTTQNSGYSLNSGDSSQASNASDGYVQRGGTLRGIANDDESNESNENSETISQGDDDISKGESSGGDKSSATMTQERNDHNSDYTTVRNDPKSTSDSSMSVRDASNFVQSQSWQTNDLQTKHPSQASYVSGTTQSFTFTFSSSATGRSTTESNQISLSSTPAHITNTFTMTSFTTTYTATISMPLSIPTIETTIATSRNTVPASSHHTTTHRTTKSRTTTRHTSTTHKSSMTKPTFVYTSVFIPTSVATTAMSTPTSTTNISSTSTGVKSLEPTSTLYPISVTSPTVNQGNASSPDRTGAIAGGIVGGVVGAIALGLLLFFLLRRQRRKKNQMKGLRSEYFNDYPENTYYQENQDRDDFGPTRRRTLIKAPAMLDPMDGTYSHSNDMLSIPNFIHADDQRHKADISNNSFANGYNTTPLGESMDMAMSRYYTNHGYYTGTPSNGQDMPYISTKTERSAEYTRQSVQYEKPAVKDE